MELGHEIQHIFHGDIKLKDSLRFRLILFITAFILLTALSLAYLYSKNSDRLIIRHYSQEKLLQEKLQSSELFQGIDSAQRDLRILQNSSVMTSLLAALEKSPNSVESKAWKKRLTDTFVAYMKSSPDFMQIRLIGVYNGGHEIVRVDKHAGKILVIPRQQLQDKSQRYYYTNTIREAAGSIYTSNIDLNREFGKVEVPHIPTIRIATPLFTKFHTPFAMLIINIDLTHAFKAIRKQIMPGSKLYVVNQSGDYLVNPDKTKEFAFSLGRRARIQDDFPKLADILRKAGPNSIDREITLNGETEFMHAFMLASNSNIGNNKMIAIHLIPEQILFKDIYRTMNTANIFAVIVILLSSLIALIFTHRLLAPVRHLTQASSAAAKGRYMRVTIPQRNDEIGLMSHSFNKMIDQIEQRETIISDNKSRYQAIFSGADSGIVIVDSQGNIEEANISFCDMLGIRQKEILNHKLSEFIEDQNPSISLMTKLHQDNDFKKIFIGDIRLKTQNGLSIPVASAMNSFYTTSGEHTAIYLYDLRSQRAAEEERINLILKLKQAQKMESIGLLASGIAHDFNNVLSCISGYSDLLMNLPDTNKQEQDRYLGEIIGSAEKAREMIRNFMLFSKNDTANFHTDDAQKAIIDIISVLEHALTSRIILTHDIDIDDIALELAPFQLQQVILNLCINARDAMEGRGEIHIAAHHIDIDHTTCSSCSAVFGGHYIALSIKDQGPGIAEEMIPKLFEPFFTTKEGDKGTGLGLYMVNSIVHEIGGHIAVDCQEGEYCNFTLYLPFSQNNYNAVTPQANA